MNVYVDADGDLWIEVREGVLVSATDGGELQDMTTMEDCSFSATDREYGPLTKLVKEGS